MGGAHQGKHRYYTNKYGPSSFLSVLSAYFTLLRVICRLIMSISFFFLYFSALATIKTKTKRHKTDYRPVSLSCFKPPSTLATPANPHRFPVGLTYNDVAVTSPYDDDQSASTSDSQSSVIHVSDSRRASLVSNGSAYNALANGDCAQLKTTTTPTSPRNHKLYAGGAASASSRTTNSQSQAVPPSRDAPKQTPANMKSQQPLQQRTCQSPTPQTTIWSPSGQFHFHLLLPRSCL